MGHLDLSVARWLSHMWLTLKHAPRHLQHTCVVLRAHCVFVFLLFGYFRLALKRPSQKVSKRICRLCFGLHAANSSSYGTGVLSGQCCCVGAHTYACVCASSWRDTWYSFFIVCTRTHVPSYTPPDSSKGLQMQPLFRSPLILYIAKTRRFNEEEGEIPPG